MQLFSSLFLNHKIQKIQEQITDLDLFLISENIFLLNIQVTQLNFSHNWDFFFLSFSENMTSCSFRVIGKRIKFKTL